MSRWPPVRVRRRCRGCHRVLLPALLLVPPPPASPAGTPRRLTSPPSPPTRPAPASWHYEMAQINMVVRALVRLMYGTALSPGRKADALDSFRRAAELAPHRLIHK